MMPFIKNENLKKDASKIEASSIIGEQLDLIKILKKASKDWDGGFVIGGLVGHECFCNKGSCRNKTCILLQG